MSRPRAPLRAALTVAAAIVILGGAIPFAIATITTLGAPPPVTLGMPVADETFESLATSPDGTWVVNPSASLVGYRAQELLVVGLIRAPNDAVARTGSVAGHLAIANGSIRDISVEADITTLRSDQAERDDHVIKYLDLFAHPTARFSLSDPVTLPSPVRNVPIAADVAGELQLLTTSRPIVVHVEARWNGREIDVVGHFDISRVDFGMDVPDLVAFRVSDEVTIEFQLSFVRTCPGSCQPPSNEASSSPAPAAPTGKVPAPSLIPLVELGVTGQLAYVGRQTFDSGTDIYVSSLGGGQSAKLTKTESSDELDPAWSPDGRTLAFTRGDGQLWGSSLAGVETPIALSAVLARPNWSPDGSRVAVGIVSESGGGLAIVDVRTGQISVMPQASGAQDSPSWSPDAGRLAFSWLRQGAYGPAIAVVDPSGSKPTALTDGQHFDYSPDWSPDGTSIAFIRSGNLWITDLQGHGAELLDAPVAMDRPAWSPDGRFIACTVGSEIWLVATRGGQVARLPVSLAAVGSPSWNPRSN